jgi:hypothetical protein
MLRKLRRDQLAVLAGVTAPLLLTVILVPFRTSFPNTDAALALMLVVVAVAANGYRLAGLLAAVSAAVWYGVTAAEIQLGQVHTADRQRRLRGKRPDAHRASSSAVTPAPRWGGSR